MEVPLLVAGGIEPVRPRFQLGEVPVADLDVQPAFYPDVAGDVLVDLDAPVYLVVRGGRVPLLVLVVRDAGVPVDEPLEGVVVAGLELREVPPHLVRSVIEVIAVWVLPAAALVDQQPDIPTVDAPVDLEVDVVVVDVVPVPIAGVVQVGVDVGVAVPLGEVEVPIEVGSVVGEVLVNPRRALGDRVPVVLEPVVSALVQVAEVPPHLVVANAQRVGLRHPGPILID